MRILNTLTTAVAAAAIALACGGGSSGGSNGGGGSNGSSGSNGSGASGVEEPPCRPAPGATVWTWPLAAVVGAREPTRSQVPSAAPSAQPAAALGATEPGPAVVRAFEPPVHRWEAGHRGVDLAGVVGEAVVAAGPGTVLFAGRVADEGVVVVGRGALRTSYEPIEPSVAVGTTVDTGQPIGRLDAGHCAATACLHWGLLSGRAHATVYYDPLLLLGCGGVRLEPLDRD
jgi:murein DD-endopeptidase MepM/ murein hydrolase activator NlpD